MDKNNSIGFFDSGIGGLTVLSECKKLLPCENFIYLSDEKNAPYGTKSDKEIERLSVLCVERLIRENVKAVVVACNTATNVAIESIRLKFSSLVVVGVEPSVSLAVKDEEQIDGDIVVLVTLATSRQEKFLSLIEKKQALCKKRIVVLPQECLASLIEKDVGNLKMYDNELERIFGCIKDCVGAVVLGCTHYIYLKQALERFFDGRIKVYDGNLGTAKRLKSLLSEKDLLSESCAFGNTKFLFSD